jgi:uncharacterized surface protein with fasciclin (FAS1) repeats
VFKKLIAAGVVAGAATAAFVAPVDAKGRPTLVTRAVEVNAATGSFDVLIDLVVALELADDLSGKGQLTVFAPTDGAFETYLSDLLGVDVDEAAIRALIAGGLSAAQVDLFTDVVLYHVTPGRRGAEWLAERVGQEIPMANGDTAEITASMTGLGLAVDGANVLIADVAASNGFIHAVDTVLDPNS